MKKQSNKTRQYPIIDGHRRHFIHYPIQNEDGTWEAVDVLPSGYRRRGPVAAKLKTEAECQKGCDIYNSFHGWSKDFVNEFVGDSMNKQIVTSEIQ